jgi:hypothetical protein
MGLWLPCAFPYKKSASGLEPTSELVSPVVYFRRFRIERYYLVIPNVLVPVIYVESKASVFPYEVVDVERRVQERYEVPEIVGVFLCAL